MKEIKLGNIFEGDVIGFTQSPHGTPDGLGIDARHPDKNNKNLIAPTDVTVSKVYSTGQQRYFYVSCQAWKVRLVHCKPTVKAGTKVKRGQKIGELVPHYTVIDGKKVRTDHCHTVIFLVNTPKCIMIYFDRKLKIQLIGAFKSKQWADWNYWNKNWGDRTLASCEIETSDPCQQYKDQIVELDKLNRDKDKTIVDQGKDIQDKNKKINDLEEQIKDYKGQLEVVSNQNNYFLKLIEWLKKLVS